DWSTAPPVGFHVALIADHSHVGLTVQPDATRAGAGAPHEIVNLTGRRGRSLDEAGEHDGPVDSAMVGRGGFAAALGRSMEPSEPARPSKPRGYPWAKDITRPGRASGLMLDSPAAVRAAQSMGRPKPDATQPADTGK